MVGNPTRDVRPDYTGRCPQASGYLSWNLMRPHLGGVCDFVHAVLALGRDDTTHLSDTPAYQVRSTGESVVAGSSGKRCRYTGLGRLAVVQCDQMEQKLRW